MPLNQEQQQIVSDIVNCINNNESNLIFIQGKAGAGKSYLIRNLCRILGFDHTVILCPTNMAKKVYPSRNFCRVATMYSYFNGEFDDFDEGYQNPQGYNAVRDEHIRNKLQDINTIVIDEISMVRADTIEMIHRICSVALENDSPFGGLNVIFVGDMFQLPPITEDGDTLQYLVNEYGGTYFFDSHVVRNNGLKFYELQHSQRQHDDPQWENLLDTFRKRITRSEIFPILDTINERVCDEIPNDVLTITTRNERVRSISEEKLANIPGELYSEGANVQMLERNPNNPNQDGRYGEFICTNPMVWDTATYYDYEPESSFENVFSYKIGARVMFTVSNRSYGYINGDYGTIVGRENTGRYIDVRKDGGGETVRVYRTSKSRYLMDYDPETHILRRRKPAVQKTKQFPLKLAYAITVHKVQGQSLPENVLIDPSEGFFAPGQLYVALSRLSRFDHLYLSQMLTADDAIVDQRIIEFLDNQRLGIPLQPHTPPCPEIRVGNNNVLTTNTYVYNPTLGVFESASVEPIEQQNLANQEDAHNEDVEMTDLMLNPRTGQFVSSLYMDFQNFEEKVKQHENSQFNVQVQTMLNGALMAAHEGRIDHCFVALKKICAVMRTEYQLSEDDIQGIGPISTNDEQNVDFQMCRTYTQIVSDIYSRYTLL